jgi:hypothetical protein
MFQKEEALQKAHLHQFVHQIEELNRSITRLQQTLAEHDAIQETSPAQRCPICWDDMNDPMITTCCQNTFCNDCILRCTGDGCPMCKKKQFQLLKVFFCSLYFSPKTD